MRTFAVALLLISTYIFANTEDIQINNDVISIDGAFESRPKSQADRLKDMRAKLEKQNELMVKKQIERLRLKQELELMKQMQVRMNQIMKNVEKIN